MGKEREQLAFMFCNHTAPNCQTKCHGDRFIRCALQEASYNLSHHQDQARCTASNPFWSLLNMFFSRNPVASANTGTTHLLLPVYVIYTASRQKTDA
eukprot:scaffold191362_cov17-Tisochrysis_lutea.AAC.2